MSPPLDREGNRGATITCSSIKRRRLARGGSNCGDGEVGPPWASLAEDLVELIGWLVLAGDLLDYVRFRAVCSQWNKSTLRPRGRGLVDPRFHPRRWMMLPEGHGLYPGHPNLGGYVRFFSLSTGRFVRVHLPLLDDHVVLDSVDGLLLLHRDRDTTICLLHPFTGDIAELPPLSTLLPQMERYPYMTEDCKLRELRYYLTCGFCAAVTVSADGAITVMISLIRERRVAHATTGDQRWILSARELPLFLTSPVSFQGKMYAVSPKSLGGNSVYICQIDLPMSDAEDWTMITVEGPLVAAMDKVHLLECNSELMLVGFSDTSRAHLVVYRLPDLISGRVVPVTNIGEHAFFLGDRSLCVTSNKGFPSVLSNSITCNYRLPEHNWPLETCGHRLIEHYHLGSGSWSLAIPKDNPPVSPYTLVHHVFTCCYRSYWNKALMFHGAISPDWSVKPNLSIGLLLMIHTMALQKMWSAIDFMSKNVFLEVLSF
ncbi:hypothetical protein U9M48_005231 [Paspalum notatum var. saurae]|uniref:KIB1-4 beta-propeller domain-containing protein n=1 Tax=Paspalum notatum var. saurae TaxID=547442 RepID=A0AAQ3PX83_PASNO